MTAADKELGARGAGQRMIANLVMLALPQTRQAGLESSQTRGDDNGEKSVSGMLDICQDPYFSSISPQHLKSLRFMTSKLSFSDGWQLGLENKKVCVCKYVYV